MSELLLDRTGRRRSPATMPGSHAGHAPGNKGLRYPADPPKVERSSPSCAPPGTARTVVAAGIDCDHVASRPAHPGGPGANRGRSRPTPRLAAGPARQGRAPSRGRHGRLGLGGASTVACHAARPPGRPAAVRHQRRDARAALVACRGACRAAAHRRRRRSAAPVRATPAPPRAHGRDGPLRRATDRHLARTRTQQPRHHQRLPAGHRQRRDHRDRPCPTRAHDPRQPLIAALIESTPERSSSRNATATGCVSAATRDRTGDLPHPR